jgi:hypothetical protein
MYLPYAQHKDHFAAPCEALKYQAGPNDNAKSLVSM